MYAYCYSNPVNLIDVNGDLPGLATLLMGGIITCLGIAIIPQDTWVTAGEAIGSVIQGISNVASSATSKKTTTSVTATKTTINKTKSSNNTVYVLKEREQIQYVGRTTNPEARKIAHQSNPSKRNLTFTIIQNNLSYFQARGLEQILITQYKTLNRGNPMNNQINGISWDNPNPNFNLYISAAQTLLGESETYVGP